jgi:uncharacterized protein (TIGR02246 family)
LTQCQAYQKSTGVRSNVGKIERRIPQKETNMDKSQNDAAIHSLIAQFVEGWNTADGSACARPFHSNADFTAINGLRARGRDIIGKGHDEILTTIYKGTQLNANVNSIEYLRPDVASVDITMRLTPAGQTWLPKHSSCGLICTQEDGIWGIAIFRNMVPFERPTAGPLDEGLYDTSKR